MRRGFFILPPTRFARSRHREHREEININNGEQNNLLCASSVAGGEKIFLIWI